MRAAGWSGPRLAAMAIVLAGAAAIVDVAAPGPPEAGLVTPLELARWIREAREGLAVVDTRPAAAYEAAHIPTAWSAPGGMALEDGITPDSRVVLYDESTAEAERHVPEAEASGAQEVRVLAGGLEGWLDDVMAPQLPESAGEAERAAFREQAEVSRWFGGLPRIVPDSVFAQRSAESADDRSRRLLGGC